MLCGEGAPTEGREEGVGVWGTATTALRSYYVPGRGTYPVCVIHPLGLHAGMSCTCPLTTCKDEVSLSWAGMRRSVQSEVLQGSSSGRKLTSERRRG